MELIVVNDPDYYIEYPTTNNLNALHKSSEIMAKQILQRKNERPNLIIYARGTSGIMLATTLAWILKPDYNHVVVSIVRKPHESSHGDTFLFRDLLFQQIIVDDMMEYGDTVNAILDRITSRARRPLALELYFIKSAYPDRIDPKYHQSIKLISALRIK